MKIENRQRVLAIVAITAVVLLASDRLIFAPLTRAWKERAGRIAELKREVTQGAMLLERERVIRTRWIGMRTNTLPNNVSAAESEVLRAFDRWEQDSRISVTSKKPQWKRNEDDYMTFECRVDASGTLPALTRFLYEVEKDPLALKVESVEIASRDNNGQQLSLALQVSGLMLNPPNPP